MLTSTAVFINIPVTDLKQSTQFFTGLGFHLDDNFTNNSASCVIVNDVVSVLLQAEERFGTYAHKPIADADSTECIISVALDTREQVDEVADQAVRSGGESAGPAKDHGYLYGRGFFDPDGHHWEVMWMDPAAR